jgi:hypothetical protein
MKDFRWQILTTFMLLATVVYAADAKEVEEVIVVGTYFEKVGESVSDYYLRAGLTNVFLKHEYNPDKDEWEYVRPGRNRREKTNKEKQ